MVNATINPHLSVSAVILWRAGGSSHPTLEDLAPPSRSGVFINLRIMSDLVNFASITIYPVESFRYTKTASRVIILSVTLRI